MTGCWNFPIDSIVVESDRLSVEALKKSNWNVIVTLVFCFVYCFLSQIFLI